MYAKEPEQLRRWDIEHFERVSRHRCIQVDDVPLCGYVSYHNIIKSEEQEQTNGEYLVDYIVERASFPNGKWTIPQGVNADVRNG